MINKVTRKNMKFYYLIVLLLVMFILSISTVHATDINTTSSQFSNKITEDTSVQEDVSQVKEDVSKTNELSSNKNTAIVKDTSSINKEDENNVKTNTKSLKTATSKTTQQTTNNNSKTITKNDKTIKTATTTKTIKTNTSTNVNTYSELKNNINSLDTNNKSISIDSDIKLDGSLALSGSNSSLTINGNGHTIDGDNNYRFITVNKNNTLILNNIYFTNCFSSSGVILNNGNITINNCTFTDNLAVNGGVLYNNETSIINNSNFYNNTAKKGSAVYNTNNQTITCSTFINNIAQSGTVYNEANLTISTSKFTNNYAKAGIDLYNDKGIVLLKNNTIVSMNNIKNNNGTITLSQIGTCVSVNVLKATTTNTTLQMSVKDIYKNTIKSGSFQIINNQNNVVFTIKNVNGSASIKFTPVAGVHNYTVKYLGDKTYNPSNTTKIVTVSKEKTIQVIKVIKTVSTNTTFEVTIKDSDKNLVKNGNIQVCDNTGKVLKTTKLNNGRVNVTLSLTKGKHILTVKYIEGTIYNSSTAKATLNVASINTKLVAKVYRQYTTDTRIAVTVTDIDNKLVKTGKVQVLNKAGKSLNISNINNGRVNITINNLPTGKQELTIKYIEGTIYNPSSIKTNVTTSVLITTKITYKNLKTTTSNTKVEVSVYNMTKNNTKIQILYSNGKLLKTATLKNGKVNVTMGLPVGKQTIKIKYVIDNYKSVIVLDTMTVTKAVVKTYDTGKEVVLSKSITKTNGTPNPESLGNEYQYVNSDGTYTITSSEILRVQKLDSYCQQVYGYTPKYTFFREEGSNIKYVIERSKWNVIVRALNKYHVDKGFKAVNPPYALKITLKDKIRYYPIYHDYQEYINGKRITCGPTSMSMISQALNNYNSEAKLSNLYKTIANGGTYANDIIKYSPSVHMKVTDLSSTKTVVTNTLKSGAMVLWHIKGHYICLVGYNSKEDKYLCLNPSGTSYNIKATEWLSWSKIVYTNNKYPGRGFMKVVPYWTISSTLKKQVANYYTNMGGKYTIPSNNEKPDASDGNVTYIL